MRPLERPAIIYSLFAFLVGTNVLCLVALLMAPEISLLFDDRQDDIAAAYENRILQLRMEVDRLHSRQYRQEGDLNLQMQELTQQQEFLAEQHRYVRILADKAEELGISSEAIQIAEAEPEVIEMSSVDDIAGDILRMLDESRLALDALSSAAESSTDEIVDGLDGVGIRLDLGSVVPQALGGPLLPASETPIGEDSLVDRANQVLLALDRFATARDFLQDAPVHYPLVTQRRISSGFGNRRDPFGGGAAFHSGIDFPATTGTQVLSAGGGRVVFAGNRSGYGKMIEIDHGNGITTRYAHLSAILVRSGQSLEAGAIIGEVGSTGRSTGPHLHFEVRRNDTPQNPQRFLDLSRQLDAYLI